MDDYRVVGIDIKIESPYGSDGEILHDPQGHIGTLLATVDPDRTKVLSFIDPYGHTVFNQLQIPVLIAEIEAAAAEISTKRLRTHNEAMLEAARAAKWASTIVKEYEVGASASDDQLRLQIARVKSHIEKVLGLLRQAANAGPHHLVRFIGD